MWRGRVSCSIDQGRQGGPLRKGRLEQNLQGEERVSYAKGCAREGTRQSQAFMQKEEGANLDGVRRARGRVTRGEVGKVKGGCGKTMLSVIARTLAFPQSEMGTYRKIRNRAAA